MLTQMKSQALRVADDKIGEEFDFFTANLDHCYAISILVNQRFECRNQLNNIENAVNVRTIFPLTFEQTSLGIPDYFLLDF